MAVPARLVLALSLAVLAGCAPIDRSPSRTAVPGTPEPQNPAETPTPSLSLEIQSLVAVEAGKPGETAVLGLIVNRSGQAVDGLRLAVSLLDASGARVAESESVPALHHLDANDVSPFAASYNIVYEPGMRATARLTGYHAATSANQPLHSETVQVEELPDGSWMLLGRLTNPGTSAVKVHELAVLAVDAQWLPTGLLPWTAGTARIEPRGSLQFVATGRAGTSTAGHFIYARAEPITGEQRTEVRLAAGPELRQTSQGEWFITGEVENLSSRPVWGQAALRLDLENQLAGMAQVHFPLPLVPGETRAFALRLPPLFVPLPDGQDPHDLHLRGDLESTPATAAEAALALLDLKVESYEFTGSRAFLRGRVTNPGSRSILTPTVFATVRSTEGKVLGAVWQVLAPDLPASAEQAFALSIDLPAQATPAMAEYDVRALGIEGDW